MNLIQRWLCGRLIKEIKDDHKNQKDILDWELNSAKSDLEETKKRAERFRASNEQLLESLDQRSKENAQLRAQLEDVWNLVRRIKADMGAVKVPALPGLLGAGEEVES